ncbi:MAG TPA: hypothetical protein VFY40_17235 [Blastocatellia bacterium]|nr:hypothetical protein [Blastocatellia bacterium]
MRKQFIQGLLTGVAAALVGAAALALLVMKLGAVADWLALYGISLSYEMP